ncbi:hypothetical protein ABE501_14940 [Comamonas testosteroni]
MTSWSIESIDDSPDVELIRWAVYEVQLASRDTPTQHLVGTRRQNPFGKVSSAIMAIDPARHLVMTASKKVYELQGESGFDAGGDTVWHQWLGINGLSDYIDVTGELLALMDAEFSHSKK